MDMRYFAQQVLLIVYHKDFLKDQFYHIFNNTNNEAYNILSVNFYLDLTFLSSLSSLRDLFFAVRVLRYLSNIASPNIAE